MEFPCINCGGTLYTHDRSVGMNIVCFHCERGNRVPEIAPLLFEDLSWDKVLANLRCPTCGYALQGLIENRCPECGRRFDPISLLKNTRYQPSQIVGIVFGAGLILALIAVYIYAGLLGL